MKNIRKETGITIAVLIVAIIILIILAGISMSAIVGDNGVLDTAVEAKFQADISSYSEELDVLEVQNKTEQINTGMDAKEYINEFKEKVEKSTVFEGSTVNKMTSVILRIQTPEGYVFIVTEDGIEYAGINGEFDEVYEVSEEDFTFTYIPSYWTNEDITVTIELNFDTESTIQYSLDGEEWIDYEEDGITIATNCIIYARLVYVYPYSDNYITGEVTNIDKLEPEEFTLSIDEVTSSTITVSGSTVDSEATDEYGKSGIDHYEFSLDGGETWTYVGEDENETTYTFTGLTQETEYIIVMKAVDVAGNEYITEITDDVTVETGKVPGLVPDTGDDDTTGNGDDSGDTGDSGDDNEEIEEANISFTFSPNDWTNTDVTIYATLSEELQELVEDGTYTLEYCTGDPTDEDSWETYTDEGVTFEENGSIYFRLNDGTNTGDYATSQVTNIDKTAPVVGDLTSTTNSVTITATDSSDGTDGVSGIVGYYISTSSSSPSEDDFTDCRDENGDGVTSLEVTVDGLKQETTYYVWVIDDAGNISEVKSIETGSVPDLEDGDVEFTLSEDDWTDEDIIVYIDITDPDLEDDIEDGTYIIEYSTDGGETWEEYDPETGIPIDENTEIQVRISDGDNTGDPISTEITNIDKTAPVVGDLTSTTNSVTITATDSSDGTDGVSGIVGYYISTSSSTPSEDDFTDCRDENGDGVTSLEVTVDGLKQETTYYVWVIDDAGNISEVKSIETGSVPDATDSEGNAVITITYSPTYWTNGKVTVTATSTESGYYMQMSSDGTNWETTSSSATSATMTVSANCTVYARLYDGTNAGDYATATITNIDTVSPTINTALSATTTTNSITLSIKVTDNSSGLSNITWYYKSTSASSYTSATDTYTSVNSSSAGTTSSTTKTHTFSGLTSGDYEAYAIVQDVAGNTIDTRDSDGDVLDITTETLPSAESNITTSYTPTSWTTGSVTVSATTTTSYTIQYSTDLSTWTTGSSVSVSSNGNVYFRLYDGTNATDDYATCTVSNIDLDTPSATSTSKSSTTNSITWKVTGTDGTSGVYTIAFYIGTSTSSYRLKYTATCSTEKTSSYAYEYTFSGLTDGTTYYLKAIVTDYAGRTYTLSGSSLYQETELLDYEIEISYSTTTWTNSSVDVDVWVDTSDLDAELLYIDGNDDEWICSNDYDGTGPYDTVTIYSNCDLTYCVWDGVNYGEEVTFSITWIDTESPTILTFAYTDVGDDYISVAITCSDDLSGVSEYYYYIEQYELDSDGNEIEYEGVEYSSSSSSITFEGLSYQSSYLITVTVFDKAGNESISDTMKISTGEISELYYTYDTSYEIGDYVEYSIDLNENGDYTDDWQIFYENDDGVVFLIADYYLSNTSKYIDFDSTGLDFIKGNYVMSWTSAPSKQTINSTTNELFMANWSSMSSSTNTNIKAISVLLNTSNWTGFVNSTYADYAIGSPTLEMFAASWNTLGYTELLYEESKYGYIFGFDEDELDYYLDLSSNTAEISGYGNSLFFPEKIFDNSINGYFLSSPDAYSAVASIRVQYDGGFQNSGFTQSNGGLRPVVALKTDIYLLANEAGIVELNTEEIEVKEANMELVYEPTDWTNGSVIVTVSLNDEDLKAKIEDGTYVYQYTFDDPTDENCEWVTLSEYENINITTNENGVLYVRLFDGSREGAYATAYINIIDRLAPELDSEEDITIEASLNNIIVSVEVTDAEATDTDGCSGIASYEFSNDGGATYYKTSDGITVYTFSDLEQGTTYDIKVKITDNAGNVTVSETLSTTTISQVESGDWVDYEININGNSDYTDDWRLFYVTDGATVTYDSNDTDRMTKIKTTASGQVFLIASDYIEADNELLDLTNTGLTSYRGRNYVLYWSSVPSKATINSTTNALFMFNFSYASSSTYNNMKCVSRLLYTSYWTSFIDSNYAQYAIGSPTLEMWITAWNEKYGDDITLYCDNETTTGYYVGSSSSPTSSSVSVSSSDGYNDTIFFPHKTQYGIDGTMGRGYWLASPSIYSTSNLMAVGYGGRVGSSGYNNAYYSVRPVVSLKSGVILTYDQDTGIWRLSN